MKRKWLIAFGYCLLLLPMLFVGALEISLRSPSTDRFTLHAPQFWRRAVSSAVYWDDFHHDPASYAAMERAARLDPTSTEAWKRRCLWAGSSGDLRKDVLICQKAVEAEPAFPLVVSALGRTQLAAGDACAAQKSFARAVSLDDNPTHYADLESMAQAALQCGDLQQARAGLEAAIKIQERNRSGQRGYSGNDDDVARRDEEKDQELLRNMDEEARARK
jgi:tetratricopeptide (TPR) repeat protein